MLKQYNFIIHIIELEEVGSCKNILNLTIILNIC